MFFIIIVIDIVIVIIITVVLSLLAPVLELTSGPKLMITDTQ